MDEVILQISSLKKSFVRNIINKRGEEANERFSIISNLDLFVPCNKISALIGGNGAGKTTLFNIISGFVDADSGKIIFKKSATEIPLLGMPPHKVARLGIGRMFQDNHIFQEMSILENMLIADKNDFGELPFISLFKRKKDKDVENERIEKARKIFVELFGARNPFWEKRNDLASTLSYGQQRLLGLARLFMGDYDLVLLDEPTAGVNPVTIEQTMSIIKELVENKGVSVFLIEHNMKVVLELADFCNFMSHGKITSFGTPEDVIGNDEVRKTYLGS